MWHTIFVTIHAVAATAAVILGVGILALPALRTPRWLRTHALAVTAMSAALPPSLIAGWAGLSGVTRPLFVALTVLSVVMVARAWLALRRWRGAHWPRAVGNLGFIVIALVTGFLTVAVLRLGGGAVGVVAVAILVPVAGHVLLGRLAARHVAV